MLRPFALCSAVLLFLLPGSGVAADLYRYVNDKGVTVLDRQGVPPELIDKGYEVLNEQGRVIRVVAPAPSRAEMQRLLEVKARAQSDAQLLKIYSTVEDVDRALQRKMAELDGLIGIARGNQQSLRTQQNNLQRQAADDERAGREAPPHLVAQIEDLRAEQARLDKDIARYEQNREAAKTSFANDRARLSELLQGNR